MNWVPLHVHSQYSILDAIASIPSIVEKAKAFQMPAVALTDHGNLFGAVEFYKACTAAGIKPIIGCEVYIAPGSRFEKSRQSGKKAAYHQTLLAKDEEGYHNLIKLSSKAYTEGFYYFPRIDKELLKEHSKGIICLSGCLSSMISQAAVNDSEEECFKQIEWFLDVFQDDFYIELQRHAQEDRLEEDKMTQESWLVQNYRDYIDKQERVNSTLIKAAKKYSVPLVATNDSHYIERADWKAHEVLINVQSGEPCEIWEKDSLGNLKQKIPNPKRRVYGTHECYFKSPEEMSELFSDVPEAISNTLKVAEKCNYSMNFSVKHYPVFYPPTLKEGAKEEDRNAESQNFLKELCYQNISKRYSEDKLKVLRENYPEKDPLGLIHERLEMELDIILSKGMCDYLLIVYDFIHWAKNNSIPVGPGRGSGAGSIILYLIGITDIEPLRFNLFFERFINPERVSYPDIDVDICMDRRGDVIDYTLNKYGRDNVAQIITFGTMKAKMAIKDVGRVLNVPLPKVNQIAKLIPDELNITIDKALEVDPDLSRAYLEDDETRKIIDMAKTLEGCVRNTGVHAAGVVICGDALTNHIPVCNAKDSELAVTQFSMKPTEQVGMLKMDFLGLKTLTCIQKAVDTIAKTQNKKIDWENLPLDDKPTFELLNQGKTLGVFQLESAGMADLAVKLHLDRFEEVIAAIALYRPGPMSMIPSFINRKHGTEKIENDHPWMEDILKETYGVMVYQEQVMQIASKLANYSLGEGDVLRRAMGKKDAQQMATQREKFKAGALDNGINEELSTKIFDKMERFAAYGFNKSHAAAYAYLSYVTAYLKANYTKEWMSALMTCDSDDISKVAKFIQECKNLNIPILSPDVNEAGKEFWPAPSGIRFAMSAIKGVGDGIVDAILQEREENGAFNSLYEFFQRINLKKVGKKNIELLAKSGCFDFCGWTRDEILLSVDSMYDRALSDQKEKDQGILNFFSLMDENQSETFSTPPKVEKPTSQIEQLFLEKELLGFFLTQHPMEFYKKKIKALNLVPLKKVGQLDSGQVIRTCFIIESVKIRVNSNTQKKFAILVISDGEAQFELPVWNDLFEKCQHLIVENQLICAIIRVEDKEGVRRIHSHWFETLLEDLSTLISSCDQAYDQTKLLLERRKRAAQMAKNRPEKPVKKALPFKMKVDLQKVRLSQILELKKNFRKFPGETPVDIEFFDQQGAVGQLQIDAQWGIELNETLKRLISQSSDAFKVQI